MFHGSLTALITPFQNGTLDERAFAALVERQIAAGTHGLVAVGTTGESPTLSHGEHKRVIELCVEVAAGRVPVIAGAGSNATREAVELMAHAKAVGADAALVVAPYYNKPSQEGLFQHYKALNDAVALPIVVYNIPGRSVVDIKPETMARIAELPNVIGLKDSAGDPARTAQHLALCPDGFQVFAGDDNLALGFAAYGAVGCISVVSNLAPGPCAAMQQALRDDDFTAARALNTRMLALQAALFAEPNPAPVKYGLSLLGLCAPDVRLPLTPVSATVAERVADAMRQAGVEP
jgi:4-hydroxy-tetrahydrodipicolinate synthase